MADPRESLETTLPPLVSAAGSGIVYQIYANTGIGDPINYATPIATTTTTTYTTTALNPGGTYRFAVRALDSSTGLVDQNIDSAVEIVLSAQGADVTARPAPPIGLRALPVAGGGIRVEWSYLSLDRATLPLGFNVYVSTSGQLSYGTPQQTVVYVKGRSAYGVTLTGYSGGAACTLGVRAVNAVGEEPNTTTITVVALATGPTAVDALVAAAS